MGSHTLANHLLLPPNAQNIQLNAFNITIKMQLEYKIINYNKYHNRSKNMQENMYGFIPFTMSGYVCTEVSVG